MLTSPIKEDEILELQNCVKGIPLGPHVICRKSEILRTTEITGASSLGTRTAEMYHDLYMENTGRHSLQSTPANYFLLER